MKRISLTILMACAALAGAPLAALAQDDTTTSTAKELELKQKELDLEKAKLDAAKSEQIDIEKQKLDLEQQKLDLEKARQELAVKETDSQLAMELSGDVLFDTNEATLKPAAREKLHQVGVILSAYPQGAVVVTGYTDNRGSADMNLALSQKRAEAVKVWLMNQSGIKDERITVKAMGEDNPAATNSTAAGRQQNRRVEITVSKS
jgi:outer membrane protein OmpA-like peptidoglycan-associated protein